LQNNKILFMIGGAGLSVVLCCLCILVGFAGYSLFGFSHSTQVIPLILTVEHSPDPSQTPKPKVLLVDPTITPGASENDFLAQPTARPAPVLQTSSTVFSETLEILENTLVPTNDLLDLAERLRGIKDIPLTVEPPTVPYQVGDRRNFWVSNVDTNTNFEITAILSYITDHSYFWIEDGVGYERSDLEALAEAFENQIYPTNREFFGSEWSPGIDGDPRLYILFARGLGKNLAGYFSAGDAVHPLAYEYSNAVEMFLLNADNLNLSDPFTYGVLAHEFQHMIHWYQDRNESTWLNEGFSELAAFLNGYYESGFDWVFMQNPDLQLNDWPNDSSRTTPHYGSGFLFVTYFLDRFGETATQALVAHSENSLTSVDRVLSELEVIDPLTGLQVQAEDVFVDWVITNFLQDGAVGDGRFIYNIYPNAPKPSATESFRSCPIAMQNRVVSQFGADYIRIVCPGSYTLRFQGSDQVGVLPEDPYSGVKAFWSNKGDESNMTLTRSFDFRDYSGPLTLTYWAWYDLEEDYDYLYLLASLDGETWEILQTPSGTDEDPSGNSYGWGYNGRSGSGRQAQWIRESVDISQYAGENILLRFEYITDAAVNGEGFLLDDVAVPEIGYFTDFEEDDGGWESLGWARIQNLLPQTFQLALVTFGETTAVHYIELPDSQFIEIPLEIGSTINEVIFIVTGSTRFTRQKANYHFEVLP
jgi:immune inhibitor A